MRLISLCVFASILCLAEQVKAAKDSKPEVKAKASSHQRAGAKSLINQGNTEFQNKEYAKALTLYRAAYELYPSPKISFNIAQAAELLGKDLVATENYEAFLSSDSISKIPVKIQAQARSSLQALAKKLATFVISGTPNAATVKLDGQFRGQLEEVSFRVKAGQKTLLVEYPQYESHKETIMAEGAQEYKLNIDLTPVPEEVAAVATGAPVYEQLWFWSTVGAVVLVGTAGGVMASGLVSGSSGSEHVATNWEDWETP